MFFLVLSVCSHPLLYSTAQNTAHPQLSTQNVDSKLQAANSAIIQAFNAILDAEESGANVTDLINQLNIASELLAQANIEYTTGNLSSAANNAEAVLPITQKVLVDAQNAKQTASAHGQTVFWSTLALASVGIFSFVLVLFLLWRWFKKKYVSNLFDTKPEVNLHET